MKNTLDERGSILFMAKIAIIFAYNTRKDLAEQNMMVLQNLIEKDQKNVYEITLINGGHPYDVEHPFIHNLIRFETNEGSTKMVNEAFRQLSPDVDYIYFTHNDCFLTSQDPFNVMIHELESKGLAVVEVLADNPPIEAYRGFILHEDADGYYCNFFPTLSWFFKKEFLDKVGYLDEGFKRTAMYMDNDWALRATKVYGNACIMVSKKVTAHHLCSAENAATGWVNEDMANGAAYFRQKWGNL